METDPKEVLRYLGYGGKPADETVSALVAECVEELKNAVRPRHIVRTYPLKVLPDGQLDFTCFRVRSKNLSRNLGDCSQVILFAATLGAEADALIRKYNRISISKAVVMQAAAAAMIEAYCDEVNGILKEEYQKRNQYLRPRFSPGYGDFPLESQVQIAGALEMGKRIGVMLTDSLLMAPSKSVTAVIGISEKPHLCERKGCEACHKTDCAYRRG